ncbi:hypothetical protein [Dolichospermum compactum]|nr:hypothetical protein [Dolichospermum compactum]
MTLNIPDKILHTPTAETAIADDIILLMSILLLLVTKDLPQIPSTNWE